MPPITNARAVTNPPLDTIDVISGISHFSDAATRNPLMPTTDPAAMTVNPIPVNRKARSARNGSVLSATANPRRTAVAMGGTGPTMSPSRETKPAVTSFSATPCMKPARLVISAESPPSAATTSTVRPKVRPVIDSMTSRKVDPVRAVNDRAPSTNPMAMMRLTPAIPMNEFGSSPAEKVSTNAVSDSAIMAAAVVRWSRLTAAEL